MRERRILVTLDKDFGELVFVQGLPHPGIIRLIEMPVRHQGPALMRLIERHATDLEGRALVVVERDRVRIHPPSSPP